MTDPFTIGDTVALRSGGTAMTVDEMKPDGVKCTWMDESGNDRAAVFSPHCLAKVLLCEVEAEAAMYRTIWVFAESGMPTVNHVLTARRLSHPPLLAEAVSASPEVHPAAIVVWPFRDAPPELRALSIHGGDEDWLAELPPSFAEDVPRWMHGGAFGSGDTSLHSHPSQPGWTVFIGTHA